LNEEIIAEEYSEIRDLIEKLPAIRAPDEPAKPIGQGVITFEDLDFDALVRMRRSHQTRQAAKGVRTKLSRDIPDDEQTKTATLKQQIIIQFHEALRESQDDKAIGTGYERSARWRAPARGARNGEIEGSIVDPLPSGNAANAAVAALSLVKQVTHWICCINVC
jgi:hypothetical protein